MKNVSIEKSVGGGSGLGLLGSGVGFLLLVGKHLPHPGFVLHG